ncbi:MAG: hypothetical protein K0R98_380 [Rickettsiaceae bacterium]|jgi:hypothetical protein|nr:hypothetical protein [Rickettsiaceae bacterium]
MRKLRKSIVFKGLLKGLYYDTDAIKTICRR